jgi:hypothetical protein
MILLISIVETVLMLNLNEAGNMHDMYSAGIATELMSLPEMSLIAPRSSHEGLFAIGLGVTIAVYVIWSEFVRALNGNTAESGVHAFGE